MRSLIFLDLHRLSCFISIHAPARGATNDDGEESILSEFQSTLPHGERLRRVWYRFRVGGFQSTLPHGERPSYVTMRLTPSLDFNPRSRTGSDMQTSKITAIVNQFQSTLPHGERRGEDHFCRRLNGISIHAPARGATLLWHSTARSGLFQSTLPHGERPPPAEPPLPRL